jgi:hypothetical protein
MSNPAFHAVDVCSPREALQACHRIDRILRRESCGVFRSLQQLITTPGYIPTLRNAVLADAYDAAQAARGDSRRACR